MGNCAIRCRGVAKIRQRILIGVAAKLIIHWVDLIILPQVDLMMSEMRKFGYITWFSGVIQLDGRVQW